MARTSPDRRPGRRKVDLAICPHCGRIFAPSNGGACPHCGYPLSAVLERQPRALTPASAPTRVLQDSHRRTA